MRGCRLVLAGAALLAGACAEPVLDSRDLDDSISEVRDNLDDRQRGAFEVAIALVRQASSGEIPGTDPFLLDGMTAQAVLAEAQRIEIRRERALEVETAAVHRELLAAEERLARLRVTSFLPQASGDTVDAELTVRNELEFPVETAWLLIEVGAPGRAVRAGEEFLAFRPPLRPGEERRVRLLLSGSEASSLPAEPPAEARYRFVLVERGGQVALQAPTAEERQKAAAALAESERRQAELDARLAALRAPE
jgi:hypothetical protein